jgi:dihydrolipoamide dehydrogenase
MSDFDLCVIGSGPGGYGAAIRAWDLGKRVCLVERDTLGGASVHRGALSSKTYWELSRDYVQAGRSDHGFEAQGLTVDLGRVNDCVARAMAERTDQLQRQLDALSAAPAANGGSLQLIRGTARFEDPHRIRIETDGDEAGRSITADHFLIATGSRPRVLPEFNVDGEHIITSDDLDRLDRFPESLVVVGAGVIGCEFATIFANFGQTRVHLIDRADRILPFEDEDVARLCERKLEEKGALIHHEAELVRLERVGDHVEYTLAYPHGGRETIAVERALISIGRVPATDDLGLENAGVECNERGYITVDDTRTTAPHIHAVGDITFNVALVNVAEIEGRHAVARMFVGPTEPLNYENLSTIMFLDPEVAAVGYNERMAQRRRIPYRVASYGYGLVGRAIAMRATEGFIKLLVSDDDEMRILGVRALGVHASTIIEAVSLMIQLDRPASDLAELFHPHPAVTEGLQECVRLLMGSSTYKPEVFAKDLRIARVAYD